MLKILSDLFWTDRLWLGPGITWADVTNGPDKNILYPDSTDFIVQARLTVLILVLRYLLKRYFFAPLGRALGVKVTTKRKLPDIPGLEAMYQLSSQSSHEVTAVAAKQLNLSQRQVERWWRLRTQNDRPGHLEKFCEHCWIASFVTSNILFGYYVHWDEDWFWDVGKLSEGYPHQGVTIGLWWYYMLSSAFVWHMLFVCFFNDIKRKDHTVQLMHHSLTAAMMSLSWILSLYRNGSMLLLTLDCSEAILETTKALKKTKYEQYTMSLFIVFTLVWFYTRLYYLPFYHVYYALTHPKISTFVTYLSAFFEAVLMIMSLYWSFIILQVIYNYAVTGIDHDVRSSSSEVSDDDSVIVTENGHKNGVTLLKNGVNGRAQKYLRNGSNGHTNNNNYTNGSTTGTNCTHNGNGVINKYVG